MHLTEAPQGQGTGGPERLDERLVADCDVVHSDAKTSKRDVGKSTAPRVLGKPTPPTLVFTVSG